MSKRSCPFDEVEPYVKKQVVDESKPRGIRSIASEKALQLLYKGATKQFQSLKEEKQVVTDSYYKCFQCSAPLSVRSRCFYCDAFICTGCTNICLKCDEDFCIQCVEDKEDGYYKIGNVSLYSLKSGNEKVFMLVNTPLNEATKELMSVSE